jgi:hypothetical protein
VLYCISRKGQSLTKTLQRAVSKGLVGEHQRSVTPVTQMTISRAPGAGGLGPMVDSSVYEYRFAGRVHVSQQWWDTCRIAMLATEYSMYVISRCAA